ncbi:hypothetical protein VFC49_09800 [Thermococcus sp. SY098]|uniref:hypothetical protein n=1 Tax=Thermococcus sp. SY098 TaxID=3111325 RepID=UPI002D773ADF|nr:hypothetical protein [Thermococcus sp. SY098]WRS52328.1 hypothetical protein VFC49_09800 [Thermococcus sp. SY098]
MRLLRFGPSLVFVRGEKLDELERFIENFFDAERMSVNEALKESWEFETIVVPTLSEEWKTYIENPNQEAFLVRMRCDSVLKELFNSKAPVERINLGPHIILFRVPKGSKNAETLLASRYNGELVTLIEGIEKGEERDTLLVLTEKKLNTPIGLEDIKASLLFKKDFVKFYKTLSIDLPVIMHKVLPEGWNEITIRLYDNMKRYEENIERLLLVLEDLDLGYAVSEGWDWDYPRPFMRIRVYKIKLITWEDPLRIKFLLKGLEYRGYKRLADIDVFVEGKKLHWIDVAEKHESKFELAKAAREELERLLSEDVKKKLHKIEAKLLQGGAHQQK